MAPVTPSEQNKKQMSTSHWAYAYCPKAPWDNRRARMATTANLDPVRTMPAAADQAECRRIDMRPTGPPSTSAERWIRQTTPAALWNRTSLPCEQGRSCFQRTCPSRNAIARRAAACGPPTCPRGMAYRQPCRTRHAKTSNSTTIANCIRTAEVRSAQQPEFASHPSERERRILLRRSWQRQFDASGAGRGSRPKSSPPRAPADHRKLDAESWSLSPQSWRRRGHNRSRRRGLCQGLRPGAHERTGLPAPIWWSCRARRRSSVMICPKLKQHAERRQSTRPCWRRCPGRLSPAEREVAFDPPTSTRRWWRDGWGDPCVLTYRACARFGMPPYELHSAHPLARPRSGHRDL